MFTFQLIQPPPFLLLSSKAVCKIHLLSLRCQELLHNNSLAVQSPELLAGLQAPEALQSPGLSQEPAWAPWAVLRGCWDTSEGLFWKVSVSAEWVMLARCHQPRFSPFLPVWMTGMVRAEL